MPGIKGINGTRQAKGTVGTVGTTEVIGIVGTIEGLGIVGTVEGLGIIETIGLGIVAPDGALMEEIHKLRQENICAFIRRCFL